MDRLSQALSNKDNNTIFEYLDHFGYYNRIEALHETFVKICENGNIKALKYIVKSRILKDKLDVEYKRNSALILACSRGHSDIVKYLIQSPELKQNATIDIGYENILEACFNNNKDQGKLDIVKFFILDLKIKNTTNLNEIIRIYSHNEAETWLKWRELNQDLQHELQSNNKTEKVRPLKL